MEIWNQLRLEANFIKFNNQDKEDVSAKFLELIADDCEIFGLNSIKEWKERQDKMNFDYETNS